MLKTVAITKASSFVLLFVLTIWSCRKREPESVNVTNPPSNEPQPTQVTPVLINQAWATHTFAMASTGSSSISAAGIYWDTIEQPASMTHSALAGTSLNGVYTARSFMMIPGKKYWVKAFAENSFGRKEGPKTEFSTVPRWEKILHPSAGGTLYASDQSIFLVNPDNGNKGGCNIRRSSDDGTSWSDITGTLPNYGIRQVYDNGMSLFVAAPWLFRSDDNGNTWQLKSPSLPTISCFTRMDNTLFVGTSTNGIFKSGDNGETWFSTGLENNTINAIYATKNLVFTCAGGNIYVSKDRGQTWTKSLSETAAAYLFIESGNRIYAAKWDGGVIYSDDLGMTWNDISFISGRVLSMAEHKGNVYFSVTGMGLFVTSPRSLECEALNDGLGSAYGQLKIAIKGTKLFAVNGWYYTDLGANGYYTNLYTLEIK